MGRRRRDDDDDDDDDFDDDDDDRPVRRGKSDSGGGSSAIKILLIVGGVLLVLFLICAGGFGYACYRTKNAIDNSFGTFGASIEAENFLSNLSIDQISIAYDSTSPVFKSNMTKDQLNTLVKNNPLLGKATSTRRALTFNTPDGSAPNRTQSISYDVTNNFDDNFGQPRATKPAGPRSMTVTVKVAEQPGGFWKVDKITVP